MLTMLHKIYQHMLNPGRQVGQSLRLFVIQ